MTEHRRFVQMLRRHRDADAFQTAILAEQPNNQAISRIDYLDTLFRMSSLLRELQENRMPFT